MLQKIKEFWEKYEYKIVLVLGFILVAVLSFEGGILRGQKMRQEPIIIEKPMEILATSDGQTERPLEVQKTAPEAKNVPESLNILPQDCAFVGSKNSNKYHLLTCRYAKSINPENRVCFSSENDAKSKGYLPDKNCIKQ